MNEELSDEEIQQKIIDFADNDTECGWLEVKGHRFPKRALIHYVFGKMKPLENIIPPYEAISPVGMKMGMDDPFHSDVWIGAGLDIDGAYSHGSNSSDALHEACWAIEKEYKKKITFDFTVLANELLRGDRTYVTCSVFEYDPPLKKDQWTNYHVDSADEPEDEYSTHRCIVIPNAGIEFDLAARNADVIITEVGGPLSHLSTVSREKGKLLIRVDNAIERFPRWSKLQVDVDRLTLKPVR